MLPGTWICQCFHPGTSHPEPGEIAVVPAPVYGDFARAAGIKIKIAFCLNCVHVCTIVQVILVQLWVSYLCLTAWQVEGGPDGAKLKDMWLDQCFQARGPENPSRINKKRTQRFCGFDTHFMYPEPHCNQSGCSHRSICCVLEENAIGSAILFNIYPAPITAV